jgi:hypothetical protein
LYLGDPADLEADQRARARPASEIPKSQRVDLSWLVGGERPFPADPADQDELVRSYFVCLVGVFGVALVLALVPYWLGRMRGRTTSRGLSHGVFWVSAFVLGVGLTPLANATTERFVFTWPASLFVVHQLALMAILRSRSHRAKQRFPWIPYLAGLAFLAACLTFFHVCRSLDLAVQWVFLMGFVPSWPIAIPAVLGFRPEPNEVHHGPVERKPRHQVLEALFGLVLYRHVMGTFLWTTAAFSAFYWAVGAYILFVNT